MEQFKVLLAFSTPTRRFAVGADIAADEIDGPLSLADWQNRGFVEKPKKTKAAPTVAPENK